MVAMWSLMGEMARGEARSDHDGTEGPNQEDQILITEVLGATESAREQEPLISKRARPHIFKGSASIL